MCLAYLCKEYLQLLLSALSSTPDMRKRYIWGFENLTNSGSSDICRELIGETVTSAF